MIVDLRRLRHLRLPRRAGARRRRACRCGSPDGTRPRRHSSPPASDRSTRGSRPTRTIAASCARSPGRRPRRGRAARVPFSTMRPALPEACLEAGAHYVDIADDRAWTALAASPRPASSASAGLTAGGRLPPACRGSPARWRFSPPTGFQRPGEGPNHPLHRQPEPEGGSRRPLGLRAARAPAFRSPGNTPGLPRPRDRASCHLPSDRGASTIGTVPSSISCQS